MTQAKQQSFLDDSPQSQGPVECLGLTFESDEARRAYFTEKLRQKLQDPEFRKIEGFPIGEDGDILALSDPPYYTACPNPFIEEFIKHYSKPYDSTEPYHREPFAADVSEGKNDTIYLAHSYHTKVPHKAIMRYILHYTKPGDLVFDGFCGTGMTGVAAQLCGDKKMVQSLGYLVQADGAILNEQGESITRLGKRRAIIADLSPAATFISYNYNVPIDANIFEREAKRILRKAEKEYGWMYETLHTDGKMKGKINYTVWSDVFLCPECGGEMVFWDVAVDHMKGRVRDMFPCPHCGAKQTKKNLERAYETIFDKAIGKPTHRLAQKPVLINYSVGTKRFKKIPDSNDLRVIEKIEEIDIPYWFPTNRIPIGDKTSDPFNVGITHVHQFYFRRALAWLAFLFQESTGDYRYFWPAFSMINTVSKLYRYIPKKPNYKGQGGGILTGTLYVPALIRALSASASYKRAYPRLSRALSLLTRSLMHQDIVIGTGSATETLIPDSSVDYVFTDPPFGSNLMYSELSILWECWLKILTNKQSEAIENKTQNKDLLGYQTLMTRCFTEYYRVLKLGRWITVEFHNTQNRVWNAIQESLQHAGFVIADVRTIDKKQGTFNQITASGAVKQDLIISAYKPNGGLEERFKLEGGTAEGAWDFVRTHLRQLPVFTAKAGQVEPIAERMDYLLFDRMVAFHVQRGVMVPLSAAEFYAGLDQRFPKRDEMYFLPDQVAEYDQKRMTVKEVLQLQLFVTDESSAIQWLKQQLTKKPQTFQELQPQFMREVKAWEKYEKPLELAELLEQNFLAYNGQGPIPEQIWSWLGKSATTREQMAGQTRETADAALRTKAKDRWYVPDPNKAGDLEKLREKALLKEFEEYRESKQKRLRVFRLESVRAGFKKAWQERDYLTIIQVAEKIPENVLQEDPKLLMWYDQAVTRLEM